MDCDIKEPPPIVYPVEIRATEDNTYFYLRSIEYIDQGIIVRLDFSFGFSPSVLKDVWILYDPVDNKPIDMRVPNKVLGTWSESPSETMDFLESLVVLLLKTDFNKLNQLLEKNDLNHFLVLHEILSD